MVKKSHLILVLIIGVLVWKPHISGNILNVFRGGLSNYTQNIGETTFTTTTQPITAPTQVPPTTYQGSVPQQQLVPNQGLTLQQQIPPTPQQGYQLAPTSIPNQGYQAPNPRCANIDWAYLKNIYVRGMSEGGIPHIDASILDSSSREFYSLTGESGQTEMIPMFADFMAFKGSNPTPVQIEKYLTDYLGKVTRAQLNC